MKENTRKTKDQVKEHFGILTVQYMREPGPRDKGMDMAYTLMQTVTNTRGIGKMAANTDWASISTKNEG